jgi:two-component system chemotaxis response regulator CheY
MKQLTGKKILIIDDSPTMRMFLSMSVKKLLSTTSVTTAVNGIDAIEKLKSQKFDLLLTDMQMPEMGEAGLTRFIRESVRKTLPIIIITTKGEEEDRDFGPSLGASGYLTKPVNGRELKEIVSRFLEQGKEVSGGVVA